MTDKLNQVEQFMNAAGQPVRYQPVTAIGAYEVVQRLDVLFDKIEELANSLGIEVTNHPGLKFKNMNSTVNPEKVLQELTELVYITFNLYHTLGVARLANLAFTEVHTSNLTRQWQDGRIHKDESGFLMNPPTFVKPDMHKVLTHYLPSLFADHVAKTEVTHLPDDSS